MSEAKISPLVGMIDKLARYAPISLGDRALLLALPSKSRVFNPGSYLNREGIAADHYGILVSGLACRHKISGEGTRQIVSIVTPGDIVNLQQLYLEDADHNIQTLAQCEIMMISGRALRQLADDHPSVARALVASMLVELSIAREWILSIGRHNARTRLAHLLCELALQLGNPSLAPGQSYELPMSQEQLADALGLTPVHINRMLKSLVDDNLINYINRRVNIPDWPRLTEAGNFNSRYLHAFSHAS